MQIPDKYRDLLGGKAIAVLTTLMSDGSPQITPVWFDYDGRHIRVNSARGRTKDRNMRRNPRVALCILEPSDPYRYLQVRGRVVQITEEGADAHIDALSRRYDDKPWDPAGREGQRRVTYAIEADSVEAG